MDTEHTARDIAQCSDVQHLAQLDRVPLFRKRNLRLLYLALIPSVLGCNMTSGYDGSVINGLQAVAAWNDYFNNPTGAILGIMSAMFMFGEIASLPITPLINDHYGRKKSIVIGSCVSLVGVAIQSGSINRMYNSAWDLILPSDPAYHALDIRRLIDGNSSHVSRCEVHHRIWRSNIRHRCC